MKQEISPSHQERWSNHACVSLESCVYLLFSNYSPHCKKNIQILNLAMETFGGVSVIFLGHFCMWLLFLASSQPQLITALGFGVFGADPLRDVCHGRLPGCGKDNKENG
jgi:hypothetical protein